MVTCPNQFLNKIRYNIPGTYSWTCPKNIFYIQVTGIGGGAGGGGGSGNLNGGSAGGFYRGIIKTSPNYIYSITVGSGGLQNTNGTSTSFSLPIKNITYFTCNGGSLSTAFTQQSIGGAVTTNLLTGIKLQGGNGGYSVGCGGDIQYYSNGIKVKVAGGGGGIGLAHGANGCVNPYDISYGAAGSGGGSFEGCSGYSSASNTSISFCGSGGAGGIGYTGGNASLFLKTSGGGAGIKSHGLIQFGGIGINGKMSNLNTISYLNAGGGGGGVSTTLSVAAVQGIKGSGYISKSGYHITKELSIKSKMFYDIFETVSGSCSGSYAQGLAGTGAHGQDSICGGGSGGVLTSTLYTCNGGNSFICGGGGGAIYGTGGNGAGGGGGGGGSVAGGKGGNGLFILEF